MAITAPRTGLVAVAAVVVAVAVAAAWWKGVEPLDASASRHALARAARTAGCELPRD